MMSVVFVALSFALSFVVAVKSFGARPEQLLSTALLYGVPLVLLAWPLYVRLLGRTETRPLLKPILGAICFPLPAIMLQIMHWVLNGELIVNPIRFFDGLYLTFLVWYVLFGLALGILFAIAQARMQRSPLA